MVHYDYSGRQLSRTAGCGPACPVVWEGGGFPFPYPDWIQDSNSIGFGKLQLQAHFDIVVDKERAVVLVHWVYFATR